MSRSSDYGMERYPPRYEFVERSPATKADEEQRVAMLERILDEYGLEYAPGGGYRPIGGRNATPSGEG